MRGDQVGGVGAQLDVRLPLHEVVYLPGWGGAAACTLAALRADGEAAEVAAAAGCGEGGGAEYPLPAVAAASVVGATRHGGWGWP